MTIKMPFSKATPTQKPNREVGTQSSAFVNTAVFTGLSDVFSADLVWSAPRAFSPSWNQIKGFLKDTAYSVGRNLQVFSSVIVEVDAKTYAEDHLIHRSARAGALAADLAALHRKDFKDLLPEGTQPRYAITSAKDLRSGQLRIRVGHAVHVPAPEDKPAFTLETSTDGAIWAAPVKIYDDERLAVLSAAGNLGTPVASWPFGDARLIVVNETCSTELGFECEPSGKLAVQFEPKLRCYSVVMAGLDEAQPATQTAKLYIRTTRMKEFHIPVITVPTPALPTKAAIPAATTAKKLSEQVIEPTWNPAEADKHLADHRSLIKAIADPAFVGGEGTMFPSAAVETVLPFSSAGDDNKTMYSIPTVPIGQLKLVAIAIQRPSLLSPHGVRRIQFGISTSGTICLVSSGRAEFVINVDADDRVWIRTATGERQLNLGETLPHSTGGVLSYVPVPKEVSQTYAGILTLPSELVQSLPTDLKIDVGRDMAGLSSLRALANKGHFPDKMTVPGDQVGLSRRHLTLTSTGQSLKVEVVGTNVAWRLTSDMSAAENIDNSSALGVIAPGEFLLVGHYLWGYTTVSGVS